MLRIDNLLFSNAKMQGVQRRQWLRENSPRHVQQSNELVVQALHQREPASSQSTLVLGAGACTEVPLVDLARVSDEVVLADLDLPSMERARDELTSSSLQKRIRLLRDDISGDVSLKLARLIAQQNWLQKASVIFDAAALCLEQCPVPDPPHLPELAPADFGLVISSLVLTQLFSYPILDVLDTIEHVAPAVLNEQERHRRYQDAAQDFRVRIIKAHLHLLRDLLDKGGVAVLLSDIRGFVFNVYGTDHDATHRRTIPLVPRPFPDLVHENFTIVEEAHWEWITDLPTKERPGRGYEVVGYVLKP